MQGLRVFDEIYPNCVEINGIVYAKELFRLWGDGGVPEGQLMRLISRKDKVITLEKIDESRKEGKAV